MSRKQKRIVVWIPEDEHNQLKSKLSLVGQNISSWIRKEINKFLRN